MKSPRATAPDLPYGAEADTSARPPQLVELEILADAAYSTREEWLRANARVAALVKTVMESQGDSEQARGIVAHCRALDLHFRKRRRAAALAERERKEGLRSHRREIIEAAQALFDGGGEPAAVRAEIARLENEFRAIPDEDGTARATIARFDAVVRRIAQRYPLADDPWIGLGRSALLARLAGLVDAAEGDATTYEQGHDLVARLSAMPPDDLADEAAFQAELARLTARLWSRADPRMQAEWARMAELKVKVVAALREAASHGTAEHNPEKVARLRELWPRIGSAGPDDRALERRYETACMRYDEVLARAKHPRIIPPLPTFRGDDAPPLSTAEIDALLGRPRSRPATRLMSWLTRPKRGAANDTPSDE